MQTPRSRRVSSMLDPAGATEMPRLSSLMRLEPGHLRSVRIDRDLRDPSSSMRFVVTPFAAVTLRRLMTGLNARSTGRAWRMTGDYGTGKSSLAMALCRLAAGRSTELPAAMRELTGDVRLAPVVSVGDREPIGRSVLRALRTFCEASGLSAGAIVGARSRPVADEVFAGIDAVTAMVREQADYDGVLLVLDELGKNLEFAAVSGEADDIFLLQALAERAVRSADEPLMLLAVLHQSVAGYAAGLPSVARREWEKVAGRFEEIVFAPPIEQTAALRRPRHRSGSTAGLTGGTIARVDGRGDRGGMVRGRREP
jgi:hypothetical protein